MVDVFCILIGEPVAQTLRQYRPNGLVAAERYIRGDPQQFRPKAPPPRIIQDRKPRRRRSKQAVASITTADCRSLMLVRETVLQLINFQKRVCQRGTCARIHASQGGEVHELTA